MKQRNFILLLLIWIGGLIFRILPGLLYHHPFVLDSWIHTHKAEEILRTGVIPFATGDYDSYWPMVEIYIAFLSIITGTSPYFVSTYIFPATISVVVPISFLLFRKILNDEEMAVYASAFIAFAGPYVFHTSGVTKETLAHPLLLAGFYFWICLHEGKNKLRNFLAFLLILLLILPTHHISLLMLLIPLPLFSILMLFDEASDFSKRLQSLFFDIALFIIIGILFFIYYFIIGSFAVLPKDPFFDKSILNESFVLNFLGFYGLLLIYGIHIRINKKPPLSIRNTFPLISGITIGLLFSLLFVQLFPLINLDVHFMIDILPFALLLIFSGYGFSYMRSSPSKFQKNHGFDFIIALSMSYVAFLLFAMFSGRTALNLVLLTRGTTFLIIAFAIVSTAGIFYFYRTFILNKRLHYLVLVFMVSLPLFTGYMYVDGTVMGEKYFGAGNIFTQNELEGFRWINATLPKNVTIASDMRVHYVLNGYYTYSVNITDAENFLVNNFPKLQSDYLVITKEMKTQGFLTGVGLQWQEIPPEHFDLVNSLSWLHLIYSNSDIWVYRIQH